MVRVVLMFFVACMVIASCKVSKNNKSASAAKSGKEAAVKEVKWMTIDEVQVAMKKEPRKVLIDFYTGWCGWCKVMDKKTYTNPDVVKYINEKFYAVKFDAERKDTIMFLGRYYGYHPDSRANGLAGELMQGNMSYPTTVFLTENFQNPTAVPGYLEVPTMEMVLKFIAENHYQTTKFPEYRKTFTPTFKEVVEDTAKTKAVPVSPH